VQGRTVITTTHRPAVTALATRTVYLRRGGLLRAEPPTSEELAPTRVPVPA
jgi:ATP-binding cassette subfamily B protein/subfamily B ATP-binding cassette protein MsbA